MAGERSPHIKCDVRPSSIASTAKGTQGRLINNGEVSAPRLLKKGCWSPVAQQPGCCPSGHGKAANLWLAAFLSVPSLAYQPITMFDSMTLRACSRSVPVSCM